MGMGLRGVMVQTQTYYPSDMLGFFESNYCLLLRLLPVDSQWTVVSARVNSSLSLEIKLIENSLYTTTISLLSTIQKGKTVVKMDKWPIRLYHDAKVAEVLATLDGRQLDFKLSYPNKRMHQPDEKYRANEHLKEWLIACVRKFPLGLPTENQVLSNE
ncbi:MAG: hypothetical protein COW84_00860 [Gammaproteobacteria bacterium CG22_combo_CG10-13_8_21_14_all_40_8]|nr:MAG: hypothetical protein COW84_00860 [Gammaproteobacteria bacterium CG22_combo_CG10-13_8_21_14_all_40_8]